MMPRLQASEQLAAIRTVALGSGNVEKDARSAAIRELEDRARAGAPRARARRASAADLAGMGIGVKVVAPQVPKAPEAPETRTASSG